MWAISNLYCTSGQSRKDIPSKQRTQKKGTPSEAVEPTGIAWQAVPQLYFSLLTCAPGPDYGEREDTDCSRSSLKEGTIGLGGQLDLGKRERGKLKVAKMAFSPWMREGRKGQWREKVSHRLRMSWLYLEVLVGYPEGCILPGYQTPWRGAQQEGPTEAKREIGAMVFPKGRSREGLYWTRVASIRRGWTRQ